MTKAQVLEKIKAILAKDKDFANVVVEVNFTDKKGIQNEDR